MQTTVNREHVIDRLCHLAAEQACVDRAEVTLDTHLRDDLNFDSLDVVEYVMTIEDEFGVNIPDEGADGAQTIRQAVEVLLPLLM